MNPVIPEEQLRKASDEELQFMSWAAEARKAGLISSWEYQGRTFDLLPSRSVTVTRQLKTKTKTVSRTLYREHTYTPDFRIDLTPAGRRAFADVFGYAQLTGHFQETGRLYIDTKGSFTVQTAQTRLFSLNRKLMYHFHGLWVEKVNPWAGGKKFADCLFAKTWCPESERWMKNRKTPTLTVKGARCRTLAQFLEQTSETDAAKKE